MWGTPTSSGNRSTARLATNATGDQEVLAAYSQRNVRDATAKQVRTKLSQVGSDSTFGSSPGRPPAAPTSDHARASVSRWRPTVIAEVLNSKRIGPGGTRPQEGCPPERS